MPDMANMIPVTYGYARISKTGQVDTNLETQLRELANHGNRKDLIFSNQMTSQQFVPARLGRTVGPDPVGLHDQEHRHQRCQRSYRQHLITKTAAASRAI